MSRAAQAGSSFQFAASEATLPPQVSTPDRADASRGGPLIAAAAMSQPVQPSSPKREAPGALHARPAISNGTWPTSRYRDGIRSHVKTQPSRASAGTKHGVVRAIALTDPARARLLSLPRESDFVFTTLRGSHYRPSSRAHHWNRVRCSAGLGDLDLYMATRHYFGWYAWNVLGLDPRDIALHLGIRTAAS